MVATTTLATFPLEIGKLMVRSAFKVVQINRVAEIAPPAGKRWLILNGYVFHITGAETQFHVRLGTFAHGKTIYLQTIASTVASDPQPLFSRTATVPEQTSIVPTLLLNDAMTIYFTGNTGAFAIVHVLEW